MKFKIISILSVLIFVISFVEVNAGVNKKAKIQYFLPEPQKWSRDYDVQADISGPKHFYFKDSENIDLNVIPIDDDLSASLNTRGVDQFIQDVLEGKNLINDTFGVGRTEVLTYNLKKEKDHQILEISCQQMIEDEKVETLERYYIYPHYAVHAQLRWRNSAGADKIKEAKKLFANFKVENKASAIK